MTFSSLPVDTIVLYTYTYYKDPTDTVVGRITLGKVNNMVDDLWSTHDKCWTTPVSTMDNDYRATLVAVVDSVESAMSNYPELFG